MSTTIIRSYFQQKHKTFRTRRELRQYQERRIKKILKHVIPKSPYTQERFHGQSIDMWDTIAPMSKTEMMENFDRLNTVGVSKDEAISVATQEEQSRSFNSVLDGYTVGLSSGTSGQLGLLLVSQHEQEEWVGRILAKVLPEHLLYPKQDRVAFFLRANSPVYERTGSKRLAFHYFDLAKDIEEHLEPLQKLDPTLLIAPPSFLRHLVPFIQKGAIKLTPQKVITVAEPLDIVDERLFRSVFKQTIHQIYQATEGFLATTCEYGTLHLNEELVKFEREPLDAQRFVPIITDLYRTSLPIIRYRLNDVLRIRPSPCSCGSILTAVDAIEGRCDDILLLPQKDGTQRPVYADFWRRCILMSDTRIQDYGLRQVEKNRLELFIQAQEKESDVRENVESALQKMMQKKHFEPVKITHVYHWPKGGRAKKKRIERKILL